MSTEQGGWEDGSILGDWDAAHAEYMKYHSIAAQEKAAAEHKSKTDASSDPLSPATQSTLQPKGDHVGLWSEAEEDKVSAAAQNHWIEPMDMDKARELALTSPWWQGYCVGFESGKRQAEEATATAKKEGDPGEATNTAPNQG